MIWPGARLRSFNNLNSYEKEGVMEKEISRREFIKETMEVGGGLALGALAWGIRSPLASALEPKTDFGILGERFA